MIKFKFIACLVLALLAATFSTDAHPGHGLLEQGATHTLTSIYHLFMLGASGVLILIIAQFLKTSGARNSCRLAGAAMLLIALSIVL